MVHYLMLKLIDEDHVKKVYALALKMADCLRKKTDFVQDIQVYENGIHRSDNADVLIILQLNDKKDLFHYLSHPAHITFAKQIEPCLNVKISFDRC